MSEKRIAYRYAKSLMGLATEKGKLDEVASDMESMDNLAKESRDLYLMLKSPVINTTKKAEILKMAFEGKLDPLSMAFIDLLVKKKREKYVPEIAASFKEQMNTKRGVTPVDLVVAVEPTEELISKVKSILKQQAGVDKPDFNVSIDPSIIGGFVLRYDNKQIDDSIATRMRSLKAEFSKNTYIKKYRH